jgi:2-polyprenyl-3-methyl-5-hydroxy-6-metoxy-1,4-benzoquinol methylase
MDVSEKSKIVKDGYDQIAGIYHSLRLAKKDLNYQYFDNLFHFFPDSGKVLDLGCGGGQPLTAYFADKGFDVTGVDISHEMIEIAKTQIPKGRFFFSYMVE